MGGNWDIFFQQADGSGEAKVLLATPRDESVSDWSQDGKYLLYDLVDPGNARDLWYLERSEEGNGWTPHPFLQTRFSERTARFSPDGAFVAYLSDQSGRNEVYVRPFPEGERQWLVSSGGGNHPRWSPDGKELFYVERGGLVAVEIAFTPNFSLGSAKRLFDYPGSIPYDVSADGQQFVLIAPAAEGAEAPEPLIRIVQNWYEEFRGREQD